MHQDDKSIKGGQQEQVSQISGKKSYYHRHSKAGQGKVSPVLAQSTDRHFTSSKLTNFTNTSNNFRSDLKSRVNPLEDELPLRNSVEDPPLTKYPSFGSKKDSRVLNSVLQTHLPKIVSQVKHNQSPHQEHLNTRTDHNSIYSTSYNMQEEPKSSNLSKRDKSNQSKIKHGNYYVGTNYGEQPN